MKKDTSVKKATLHFDVLPDRKKPVRDGLSSVVRVGDSIWVACDEGTTLERLKKLPDGYGEHTSFSLMDYVTLPGDAAQEIDIEGIDYEDYYLWITGSHGLKRKKPRPEDTVKKQIKRLSKVTLDPNRYVLARIPLVPDAKTGEWRLHKTCPHPKNPEKILTAATLAGTAASNELTDALCSDVHIKDYMPIPGKDNGFDIEGLIVDGNRLFLGLRGPVLRGWAIILEIETEESDPHTLRLREVGPKQQKYKKHFLDLAGMGIREMAPCGEDMLILAGPTMVLDGTIAVFRWKGGLTHTTTVKRSITYERHVDRLFDTPHLPGYDRAEGLAVISGTELLVVYDSPATDRKVNETDVLADIVSIQGIDTRRRSPPAAS